MPVVTVTAVGAGMVFALMIELQLPFTDPFVARTRMYLVWPAPSDIEYEVDVVLAVVEPVMLLVVAYSTV